MGLFTGNALKILAAVCMVLDHVGIMFFPQQQILRLLGRLAFPIYAYMIAEGCRYTRSRKRYWGFLFALAMVCQVVYFLFDGTWYFSILVTFSLSIPTIFALDYGKTRKDFPGWLPFLGAVAALWVLNKNLVIDYGFWGCMAPVFASLPVNTRFDTPVIRIGCFGLGLLALAMSIGPIQYAALLALPVLLCYNGRRGKWKMKYFFYIFYPAHLVILQGIAFLMA